MRTKRIIPLIMSSILAISIGLTGCGSFSSGPISDEYVEISKYKGLEVQTVEKTTITDEMVETTIQQTLASNVVYETVDRAAENEDQVNINFVGKIDGKAFDNGSAEGYDLVLGSGSFIGAEGDYKGFEEQLIGHKKGEKFDIKVKFPEAYAPELAGKVATFTITMNEVKEPSVPELTDEIVSSLSQTAKTADEYRAEVKKQLQDTQEENYKSTLQNEVYDAFVANIKVVGDLDAEIEEEYKQRAQMYEYYAQMYGVDINTLYTQMGVSEETLKETAGNAVAFKHACNLVGKKCHLTLSDANFKTRATELAKEQGFTDPEPTEQDAQESTEVKLSAYDQFIAQYGEDYIREYFLQQDVMDYLTKHCKQVDKTEASTASEPTADVEAATEAK